MGASVRIGGDEWGVDDLYIVFVADWVLDALGCGMKMNRELMSHSFVH